MDEIDSMDWARYNRALYAKSILESEEIARSFRAGKIKAKDIAASRWERIRQNDELMSKRTP